mgnify:FL=1
MKYKNLALVFFNRKEIASNIMKKLRDIDSHAILIHAKNNKEYDIISNSLGSWQTWMICIISLLFVSDLAILFTALKKEFLHETFIVLCVTLGFVIFLAFLFQRFYLRKKIDSSALEYCKQLILPGETLVIIENDPQKNKKINQLIQDLRFKGITSYLVTHSIDIPQTSHIDHLPKKPLTQDYLAEEAFHLGLKMSSAVHKKDNIFYQNLGKKINQTETHLRDIYSFLNQTLDLEHNILLSTEWLLDNAYAIKGHMKDISRNLPSNFYQKLPLLKDGNYINLPRVYGMASQLVLLTDGYVDKDNINAFIESFQKNTPLTIGELWSFPLILRLSLIESIEHLADLIIQRLKDSQQADFWGDRLLNATRKAPDKLYFFMNLLTESHPQPSTYFASQLVDHLYDDEGALLLVKNWFEKKIGYDLSNILQTEQNDQTVEQTSTANCITSLHRLKQLDWREVFEKLNVVNNILGEDFANVYAKMDFSTKDLYRHHVEKLSKVSSYSEFEIARQAVLLSQQGTTPLTQHVGYYIIDRGIKLLKNAIDQKQTYISIFKNFLEKYTQFFYIGSIATLSIVINLVLIYFIAGLNYTNWQFWLFFLVAIIPSSEIALQTIHYILSHSLKPVILPKMNYEKEIPTDCQTLVVIPVLLSTYETIKRDVLNLEIRYLSNPLPNIYYSLFADDPDSSKKHTTEDTEKLNYASSLIEELNSKYGNVFYLFYRERKWNSGQNCWMAWERKRGKLEELNKILLSNDEENFKKYIQVGEIKNLFRIKYVLTLDSDTQLPLGKARNLIETISHPLNKPYVSPEGNLERGYTIIQPRVSTSFPSGNESFFSTIYSDPSGTDPYTKAVSDIYQDLFHEGVYHGKGIYEVKSFNEILDNRFPENLILSHDLLEGAYVGTGFASDIELHDSFPNTFHEFSARNQRWVRGDWQITQWLFSKVPSFNGLKQNTLSLINRWKIFDNLRRSFLGLSLILLILCGAFYNISYSFALFAGFVIILPIFFQITDILRIPLINWPGVWEDLKKCLYKTIFNVSLLPYMAWINTSAIVQALYRRTISKKNLLDWNASLYSSPLSKPSVENFILSLITLLSITLLGILFYSIGLSTLVYLPFFILWIISPVIAHLLNKKKSLSKVTGLSEADQMFLLKVARKTWRFFDEFVGPQNHWLPPDNFQEDLRIEVAKRTSTTNIGMYFTSILSCYELGFISSINAIERIDKTIRTIEKLEHYEGHPLNWYDTETLQPLSPKYVSTVDSGNMLGSLWMVEQALNDYFLRPLVDSRCIERLRPTLRLLKDEIKKHHHQENNLVYVLLDEIQNKLETNDSNDLLALYSKIEEVYLLATQFKDTLKDLQPSIDQSIYYWAKQVEQQVNDWRIIFEHYLPWCAHFKKTIFLEVLANNENLQKILIHLKHTPSLVQLADNAYSGMNYFFEKFPSLHIEQLTKWYSELQNLYKISCERCAHKSLFIHELKDRIEKLSNQMNMSFLFNSERKLFSIGYHVSDHRMDTSFYDLLASEARLASFLAIAKREAPVTHWWSLGRPFGRFDGLTILQSWGGTMFEYLMPVIYTKQFENSLLDIACKDAVFCQITYGKKRNIPWGISESAYSGLDIHKIYQYRAFGVPGLGLKRGLENDLVVTPYSSALALMIDPIEATNNLRLLSSTEAMFGEYGFFEAIDYSREKTPKGRKGVLIGTYMAHHQGMSISAIANTLNDNCLQKLFHLHPKIKAVESLLYERPSRPTLGKEGRLIQPQLPKLSSIAKTSLVSLIDTPNTTYPLTHLLSNGHYNVMITNSGGGYSRFENKDITVWRADITRDSWGSFFYINDKDLQTFYSPTFHPFDILPKNYTVNFSSHKAEFKRFDNGVETISEIYVSPEDNVEIRTLTFANHTQKNRPFEILSFQELAMAPHLADLSHPVFNKMFIETESIEPLHALIAFRRPRSAKEEPLFCFHLISCEHSIEQPFSFETSREKFIGRGNTLGNPDALNNQLTNSVGFVLDPIFSIKYKFIIEAKKKYKLSFVTGVAKSKAEALNLIKKYKEFSLVKRAEEMAWTHEEIILRHLHIRHEQAHLFQQLASRVIFPSGQLAASPEKIRQNTLGQSGLWAHGISGDIPIVLATISNTYDIEIIQQILIAHTYWHLHGLKVDLVILNEEHSSYEQTLNDMLNRIVQPYIQYIGLNKTGGIFIRFLDQMAEDHVTLLYTCASLIINTSRGDIRQHLAIPIPGATLPQPVIYNAKIKEEPSPPLPFLELKCFNSIGGFSQDGKEYIIYLSGNLVTPAPWINVVANPQFGFLASERGLVNTWFGNSQSNRLTPWSNDPLIDPITDVIYLRDEETGVFWTITSGTIREKDAYRIRHGQGYTIYEHISHAIEQEMKVFVPLKDDTSTPPPVRIQIIRLKNHSNRKRKLSLFAYNDLVLGTNKEQTQKFIVTNWNVDKKALLATNSYHPDYPKRIAFLHIDSNVSSYTTNRTEFIGRNGSLHAPSALKRIRLGGTIGANLDSCFAIQSVVEINPSDEVEIVVLLGEGTDLNDVKQLIDQYGSKRKAKEAFINATNWWDSFLTTIQVETPSFETNIFINRWMMYQNLSCRIWGRTAFYQSGGAFGFRDQLQDVSALILHDPELTKRQILLSASRQFIEGDVQHWWHPPSGNGVRTRITDDLLWLPLVTALYIRVTGDYSILNIEIPFIEGRVLEPSEHEIYLPPTLSKEKSSLLDHCKRAIDLSLRFGKHGMPLIGGGDWNDGMNTVGLEGKGESVWLGWFLATVLNEMLPIFEKYEEKGIYKHYKSKMEQIIASLEENCWDGNWYVRAFFDNGQPIGSSKNIEDKIDSLPQSWSILSNLGNKERSKIAMNAVEEFLVKYNERLILLFTPPFDKSEPNPGYIMGYPPGVRENGGQYTHAAGWVAAAYARMGNSEKSLEILNLLNPILRTLSKEQINLYKIEPYVLPGDIYSLNNAVGRGGWSWYTGSAGVIYRAWIEEIFGLKFEEGKLKISPQIPLSWNHVKLTLKHKKATYHIHYQREENSPFTIFINDKKLDSDLILLEDNNNTYTIVVKFG